MSNPLSVRRVKIQTLDEKGKPEGEPSYGILAADDFAQTYIDVFDTFEDLNKAIAEAGCILDAAGPGDMFGTYDREEIGTNNYYGKSWPRYRELDNDEENTE